jgi:hypothetical protein
MQDAVMAGQEDQPKTSCDQIITKSQSLKLHIKDASIAEGPQSWMGAKVLSQIG